MFRCCHECGSAEDTNSARCLGCGADYPPLKHCPSCQKLVAPEAWDQFAGVCIGCDEAIRELPA